MANLLDVANCFLHLDSANDGDGISNLKLQKLAYYAQGFYAALFGKPLFNESIEAWTHGPVVPDLYHVYKEHGSGSIPPPGDFDSSVLAPEELGLIQEVFEVFGQFSAWKLRNMTHEEAPWVDHARLASVIPFEDIESYFKTRLN